MRSSFASVWAVGCVAAGLLLATLHAAEPPHPLVGATRDQVFAQYGEPKGVISVGNRTVLTYPQERLVLRDNVVVEVERLASEPVRRAIPAAAESAPSPAGATSALASDGTPVAAAQPSETPAPAAPAAETKLEIKLVRPPGSAAPPPREVVVPAPVEPELVEPVVPVAPQPPKPDPAELARKAARAAELAAEAAAQEKRLKAAQSARRRLDFADTATTDEGGPGLTLLLGFGVIAGGIGALVWWRRQQSLTLEATSVAATPVKKIPAASARAAAPAAMPAAASAPAAKPGFTREFIAQLDAGRFEELVAAYFTKTGVVATRTKTGAASPLHLRISWKGEPRAFACAQCITPAPEPIEARALHPFAAALAAEDLRRGYVVTSGGFSPEAVAFAAAKRLTLMSVDNLIEKIGGLPESARQELLQILGAAK
ncbi:MAG: restriction endonuclease [Opitutaceae bacterium]|nr:restriction endonuclease [Opitutaceae bacterium]